jgi:Predicted transcriptional regulators
MQKRADGSAGGSTGGREGGAAGTGADRERRVLVAIGRQIRVQRERRGIPQERFAAHAGIDRSYYGAVERGRYSVTALNLVKIALALEVEVGDLFPPREQLEELLAGEAPEDAA